MTGLTTRDALAEMLHVLQCPGDVKQKFCSGSCGYLAEQLLASGAVIDAATLADDEDLVHIVAGVIHEHAYEPTGYKSRAILRALAAALTERTPQ